MPTLTRVELVYGADAPGVSGPCPVTPSQARGLLEKGLVEWIVPIPLPGFELIAPAPVRQLHWTRDGHVFVSKAFAALMKGRALPPSLRRWPDA